MLTNQSTSSFSKATVWELSRLNDGDDIYNIKNPKTGCILNHYGEKPRREEDSIT
jgi:hypothetical protein